MGTTGQSITLANSIIGVGILAMPFCFQQCGVVLASLILLCMGLMSRLCCYFLLKSALLARKRNFEFLAFHVFGSAGKLAVEVGIIGFLMGTCIAYFVVVGDLGPQIVAKMFNINQSDILRTSIMVIVSLVCVLPLGLLRNVDSLSNVSAATIAFYFCLVMKVITEAASQLMSSDWHGRVEMWRPAGVLQCVPIFSMALFCQAQLFEIFESLPSLSLEKMNVVTKNAINICTGVYFTLGVFGYIAFSSQDISGNILMSLSPTMASDVIKLGFVMSLAFSFPLIIFPCRASLYSCLYKKVHSSHHDHILQHSIPAATFRCMTVAIVGVALFVSLLLPNIELVLGLLGSTIGVLICVVFPAACFVNVTFKNTNERLLAKGVLILGLIIMVLGTYANLQAAENQRLERYEDKYTQERIDKMVEDFFESRGKDEVYLKPDLKTDSLPKELPNNHEKETIETKRDSEVQPPNPVPPESQSKEKVPVLKEEIVKPIENKIVPILEIKDTIDKVSETHPRNLKNKLEAKLINGNTNVVSDKPKEVKPQSNEDKIDMIKQQQLIETIKKHGEEQKELIKEQKEILDEIYKTKKELQQNKKEESNDAKIIAVESIKQIANMAIQSIGGEPDQIKNGETNDRVEKLTNEAVQEIAKKAVETMEAIQEIKNPEQPLIPGKVVDGQNPPNLPYSGAVNTKQEQNSQVNNIQQANIPQVIQNVAQPQQNIQAANELIPDQSQNVQSNPKQNVKDSENIQLRNVQANQNIPRGENVQSKQNIPSQQQNDPENGNVPSNQNEQAVKPQIASNAQVDIVNIESLNNAHVKLQAQNVETQNKVETNEQVKREAVTPKKENIAQNVDSGVHNLPKKQTIEDQAPVQSKDLETPHSHSNDEPKSYKVGEDTQAHPSENKIVQNVPLPIANNNNQAEIPKKPLAKNIEEDIHVKPNQEQINGANQNAVHRQKREVIDCTQKVTLKPEDKQICDTLIDRPKENIRAEYELNKIDTLIDSSKKSNVILPEVDLNKIALLKELPLDTNVLHYMGRSLKSYDQDKR